MIAWWPARSILFLFTWLTCHLLYIYPNVSNIREYFTFSEVSTPHLFYSLTHLFRFLLGVSCLHYDNEISLGRFPCVLLTFSQKDKEWDEPSLSNTVDDRPFTRQDTSCCRISFVNSHFTDVEVKSINTQTSLLAGTQKGRELDFNAGHNPG